MKRMTQITFFLGIALMGVSVGAVAQLYRCATDDGRTVYSDRKCAPADQRTTIKITDNSMDYSGLAAEAAIRGSFGDTTSQGGASVAVIGNGASAAQSSTPAVSAPVVRRRCRG